MFVTSIFAKPINAQQHGGEITTIKLHLTGSRNMKITGSYLPLKYNIIQPTFTKLILAQYPFVKNSHTLFQESSTNALVADTRSQTDRHGRTGSTYNRLLHFIKNASKSENLLTKEATLSLLRRSRPDKTQIQKNVDGSRCSLF